MAERQRKRKQRAGSLGANLHLKQRIPADDVGEVLERCAVFARSNGLRYLRRGLCAAKQRSDDALRVVRDPNCLQNFDQLVGLDRATPVNVEELEDGPELRELLRIELEKRPAISNMRRRNRYDETNYEVAGRESNSKTPADKYISPTVGETIEITEQGCRTSSEISVRESLTVRAWPEMLSSAASGTHSITATMFFRRFFAVEAQLLS